MLAIKHILFPIDFSDRCCAAVPFIANMATRFGAKITLMSVAPLWYTGVGDPGASVVIDPQEILEDLKTRLDSSLVKEFTGIPVDRVAELGDPAQLITGYAHSHGVDLIMMPTHGYGPFRNLLLGSVTAKVLHDVQCPVWTAAHMEELPAREHLECRTILCAVDATPKSVPLMKWAAELSKATGAALRLAHVIPGMEDGRRDRWTGSSKKTCGRKHCSRSRTCKPRPASRPLSASPWGTSPRVYGKRRGGTGRT